MGFSIAIFISRSVRNEVWTKVNLFTIQKPGIFTSGRRPEKTTVSSVLISKMWRLGTDTSRVVRDGICPWTLKMDPFDGMLKGPCDIFDILFDVN